MPFNLMEPSSPIFTLGDNGELADGQKRWSIKPYYRGVPKTVYVAGQSVTCFTAVAARRRVPTSSSFLLLCVSLFVTPVTQNTLVVKFCLPATTPPSSPLDPPVDRKLATSLVLLGFISGLGEPYQPRH